MELMKKLNLIQLFGKTWKNSSELNLYYLMDEKIWWIGNLITEGFSEYVLIVRVCINYCTNVQRLYSKVPKERANLGECMVHNLHSSSFWLNIWRDCQIKRVHLHGRGSCVQVCWWLLAWRNTWDLIFKNENSLTVTSVCSRWRMCRWSLCCPCGIAPPSPTSPAT